MAVILWAGLRQLEMLRTALRMSVVDGSYSLQFRGATFAILEQWFNEEGLQLADFLNGQTLEDASSSAIPVSDRVNFGLMQTTNSLLGSNQGTVMSEGQRATDLIAPEIDHGVERSSVYWSRQSNLLTSSILIRLLATLEIFEVDALKALLFYRPLGRGAPADSYQDEVVEEKIVFEVPSREQDVDYFNYPPLWTWIKRSAEDNTDRRKILSRVYGITFTQPNFGKKLADLYEMRNALAHGRKRIDVSISLLLKVDAYAANSMIELRNQIFKNYRLQI